MKVEEVEKSSLWTLFSTFFCIGIVTFGGGYAMIPLLERQCCTKHKWSSSEEILEYYAVSQCTPGIIAVNVATFIGYKVRGIIGAIVGTLGLVCPSILIITFLANLISMFQDNIYVLKAFSGIRVAVCALLISAVLNVSKKSITGAFTTIIALLAFGLQVLFGISPVLITIGTITLGVVLYFIEKNRTPNKEVNK